MIQAVPVWCLAMVDIRPDGEGIKAGNSIAFRQHPLARLTRDQTKGEERS